MNKLAEKGVQNNDIEMLAEGATVSKKGGKNLEKSLEMLFNEVPETSQHKLKVNHLHITLLIYYSFFLRTLQVIQVLSEDSFNDTPEVYAVYKKYQMIIHKDPASKVTELSFKRFLVDSPLKVI